MRIALRFYFLLFFFACAHTVLAQTALPSNTIVYEHFNSMGNTGNATLPTNWKLSSAGTGLASGWNTGTNINVTSQQASSGTPSTGGAYNWGTSGATDRAIGFLTTASYASPNAVMAYYRNTTGAAVSTVTISYSIERYVINTAVPTVDLYYSTNGSTWTAVSGVSTTATDFPSAANAFTFATPKTINKTASVTISGGLANNADIYFKWVFTTGASNSQGLGLNNVSVFAGIATPVVLATLQDLLQIDNGTINQFNEGDVIRYKTVIKNAGTGDATGVQVTLPAPPANTTMVGGSIKTSAVAVDDSYATSFNTVFTVSSVAVGVLNNDIGVPTPSAVLTFGTTADATLWNAGVAGTTDAGGSITLNANGTFTYTPPTGFNGVDKFKYITGNGNLPNNDGTVTLNVAADISFTTTNTDPTCNNGTNGSITFNASGGNGGLQYSITGVAGTYQSSNVFIGLNAGTYNLAVRDAGGLIKTSTTTLNNPAAIVVSGTVPTLTYNTAMSTVNFTKTGGAGTITWSASGLPTGLSLNTATGDLTGTATVTGAFNASVTATDANGCSGSKSVTINVAPKLSNDVYNAVGNTQLVADVHSSPSTPFTASATNIKANDQSDVTVAITAVTNAATAAGGTITIDAAGKFTYTPPNGSTAADSYTYTGTSNGVSATATINFAISNMVWYVNNTYGGANGAANGSSHRPYTDLAAASTAAQVNQVLYVHTGSGNTTGNATLKSGQTLRGAGSALNVGSLSIAAGTKPILSGTVILASSVTVDGFDMNTGALTALTNAAATVTGVTINIGNVTTNTGSGIAITGTGNTVTATLASLTTNSAANAINLAGTAGSITINGGTLTGGAGAVVLVNGGTVSLTYGGSASQATAAQPLVSISGGHTTGTILFQTGTLSATSGTGLQFDNADGTYNFNGTTTLNGGDAGIDILNGSSGNFIFPSTASIANPSGTAITINASAPTVTYSGTLSKTNNAVTGIAITSNTGGTISINGTGTKTLSTQTATAVNLTTNTGATINFSGNNWSLTTTTGTGFNATGGGTISVAGTGNTINSSAGIALNVVNTSISATGLTFQSIAAASPAALSGIILNNTGSSGGLTVTGTGTAGSGGTIQSRSQDAISLISTTAVNLSWMTINANTESGILGSSVNGLNLTNLSITGNGDDSQDCGIKVTNLWGSCTWANLTVTGSALANAYITNTSGTLSSFTITGGSFSNLGTAFGSNSILVEGLGTAVITSGNVSGVTISNNKPARGITVQAQNGSQIGDAISHGFFVQNCSFTNNGLHASFEQSGTANLTFKLLNNGSAGAPMTMPNTPTGTSHAVNVFSSSTTAGGSIIGTISGNYIGNSAVAGSGSPIGNGIRVAIQGKTDATLLIASNVIRQVPQARGIDVQFLGTLDGTAAPVSDVTIINNDVNPQDNTGFPTSAIYVAGDSQSGGSLTLRCDVRGNTVPAGSAIDVLPNFLVVDKVVAAATVQLVDNPVGPGGQTPTQQLQGSNTGNSGAQTGVVLITGPITIPW